MGEPKVGAGTFYLGKQAPTFNSAGDDYGHKEPENPKWKGKQMVVNPTPRCTGKNWANPKGTLWDSKAQYLSEGDKYEDPSVVERKAVKEKNKKLPERPWKGTNPVVDLGTHIAHETEYIVERKGALRKPFEAENTFKTMLVPSAPKGGPGTIGRSIGGAGEVHYISDPYERKTDMERSDKKKTLEKLSGKPAFHAAGKSAARTFDGDKLYAAAPSFKTKVYPACQPRL